MLSKSEIKDIRALSQKKFRDERRLFVVEGEKLVAEALASDFEVVRVLRQEETGQEVMARISMLSTPSPVLAVVRMPDPAAVEIDPFGLTIALDSLRDPGNVGTIIRLADWFGIRNIIASSDTVDIYNPKVVQATMGAIFRVKFSYCDLPSVLAGVSSCPVYGTYLEGDNIYDSELSSNGIIIMGSESNGISAAVGECVTGKITIPRFSSGRTVCESLNVAVAAAVICSEFRRR